MNRWYAVHTHARAEQKALQNLHQQGFNTYLPRYRKRRRHARRIDWVSTPLFPRYLFVELDMERHGWRPIQSTFGVQYLVCNGDQPAPVPLGVVESMKTHEDGTGLIPLEQAPLFRKGDQVRIETGPFSGHVGLFDSTTDEERVTILLDLMGRQVKAKVSIEAVNAHA
jgi:transcriptional antiterminator RfaH